MAAVSKAREEIARAITLAGLQRDPLRHPLQAISVALDAMEETTSDVRRATAEAASVIRRPISPEAEASMVSRLERAATAGADRHAAALVQRHDTRNLIAGIGAAALCVTVAALGGYWFGASQTRAEAAAWASAQTARLEMLKDSPAMPIEDAALWASLIRYNPSVAAAIAQTQRQRDANNGRSFGLVPLWLEVARPATPRQ